jgi:hypothetical protein
MLQGTAQGYVWNKTEETYTLLSFTLKRISATFMYENTSSHTA